MNHINLWDRMRNFLNFFGLSLKIYHIVLIVIVAALAAWVWQKKHPQKIAYAETAVLLNGFVETEMAKKQFEASRGTWDSTLKAYQAEIRAHVDIMNKTYATASVTDKAAMRLRLDTLQNAFESYQGVVRKEAATREKALMDPVVSKVNTFLAEWGPAHGYSLIIGAANGTVLAADTTLNVTQRVLKDINESYRRLPESK